MSDRDDGKWYVGGSWWGEYFIERHCTVHDPQWSRGWVNGIPYVKFMDGLYDHQLACDLVDYLNQVYLCK